MGIKTYKPYTPSRRNMTGSDFSELYASFKYGDFAGERDGRYFHDMNEVSVEELFITVSGFRIEEVWQSHDVRRDKEVYWINVIARNI